MNEAVKVEVALEIITIKIGMECNNKNDMEIEKLTNMRNEIYKGNFEQIDLILKLYGKDIKQALSGRK